MANAIGGFGAEHYGDPFGGGSYLHIVRALAVAGQTVRVAFNEEPVRGSAASSVDARNPSNYQLALVSGIGTVPNPVGVDDFLVVGPALGVRAGEFGMDVRVDHPLAVGIRYRVTARRIQSRSGDSLGAPYAAEFMGVQRPDAIRPPARKQSQADLSVDPFSGAYNFDGTGDIAVQDGLESYRKRILRRAQTPKGAFRWDLTYGTILALKRPITIANLGELKRDLQQQIQQEPETSSVDVQTSLVPLPGILTVAIIAHAKPGTLLLNMQRFPDGRLIIPA